MARASTAFPHLSSTTPTQITDTNSPFRYPGGKFYARKLILEHLYPHDFYCEPFAGGASIFFAKGKVEHNWLNDKDADLVNCMTVIRDRVEDLISALAGVPATKEFHGYYKNEFKATDSLTSALRWYYLNRVSYSGIMKMENCYWGYGEKYSMRPENWPRHLRKCSEKLQGVKLTCTDFEEVIAGCPDGSFLFVDPPYFDADQDKFYTHSFTLADHYRLRDCLYKNCDRVRFLLTYDNSPEIVDLYSWAKSVEREWTYTIQRTSGVRLAHRGVSDEREQQDRVDRRDLEPGARLHEGQPRLPQVLRRGVCREVPRGEGPRLRAGLRPPPRPRTPRGPVEVVNAEDDLRELHERLVSPGRAR